MYLFFMNKKPLYSEMRCVRTSHTKWGPIKGPLKPLNTIEYCFMFGGFQLVPHDAIGNASLSDSCTSDHCCFLREVHIGCNFRNKFLFFCWFICFVLFVVVFICFLFLFSIYVNNICTQYLYLLIENTVFLDFYFMSHD